MEDRIVAPPAVAGPLVPVPKHGTAERVGEIGGEGLGVEEVERRFRRDDPNAVALGSQGLIERGDPQGRHRPGDAEDDLSHTDQNFRGEKGNRAPRNGGRRPVSGDRPRGVRRRC